MVLNMGDTKERGRREKRERREREEREKVGRGREKEKLLCCKSFYSPNLFVPLIFRVV